MNPQTTIRRVEHTLTNATTIATTITPALTNLDRGLAGWPTSTPGASPITAQPATPCVDEQCTHIRPCPIHDETPVALTKVEQLGIAGDQARSDLEHLLEHIRKADHHLKKAAELSHKWAWTGVTESTVKARLVAIDAGIWCENCVQFGEHNPREVSHRQCSFCRQFQSDYKRPAPKQIWDARNARGGRIDQATISRILTQLDVERKQRRDAEKAEARAERDAMQRSA